MSSPKGKIVKTKPDIKSNKEHKQDVKLKVHIPPLMKFRPETPCGVKRSHAKTFRNRNCGFPTIKLF